jgi:predicted nucleic acid-binding protein
MAPPLPIERLVALTETLRDSAIVWVPLTEAIATRARELSLGRQLAPAYDGASLGTAIEIRAGSLYT